MKVQPAHRRVLPANDSFRRGRLIIAVAALAVSGVAIVLLFVELPAKMDWVALALIAVNSIIWGLPVFLQVKARQIDIFHPLVLAALSFAFPMLLIRGIYLALGGDSPFLGLTGNPSHFTRMALIYFAVGWTAVLIGFYVPLGGSIIKRLKLPGWLVGERRLTVFPVAVVFLLGVSFNLIMIREGAFGSSLSSMTGDMTLVSIIRPLCGLMSMAFFLFVFGSARYFGKNGWRASALGSGIIILGFTFVSGSRAALFSMIILATMAFFYGRYGRLGLRRIISLFGISLIGLMIGVLVITQYRNLRVSTYSDLPVSIEETISLMGGAIQDSGGQLFSERVSFIGTSLMDRFVGIDLLGVTLARAESLKSAEEEAGINNNIINELFIGSIPRVLWPAKPLLGEFGLTFTRIYLDSPYRSSNGPTMFGDLYRNFGFIGVPIGMFIVGLYLRVLYGSLIQHGIRGSLAPLFYVSLYGIVSWESTYTPFITNGVRTLFALLIMSTLIRMLGGSRLNRKAGFVQQRLI